jgi:hypothetical protein
VHGAGVQPDGPGAMDQGPQAGSTHSHASRTSNNNVICIKLCTRKFIMYYLISQIFISLTFELKQDK